MVCVLIPQEMYLLRDHQQLRWETIACVALPADPHVLLQAGGDFGRISLLLSLSERKKAQAIF